MNIAGFEDLLSRLSGVSRDVLEDLDTSGLIASIVSELRRRGVDVVDYSPVYWCYTGDRECEEEAWRSWQKKLRRLARYLNQGYEIVELQEQDEGDSLLLVVPRGQVARLQSLLESRRILALV